MYSSPVPPSSSSFQHRISTNAETGAVTHPLIPHAAHLGRRRRELGEDRDHEKPAPRPRVSRHFRDPGGGAAISIPGNESARNLQQQMGALYQGYGTHYVDLWVGSPDPQRQTVIVDTGSGFTAFPCEECKGCGDSYHTDKYFRESKSETFRPLGCDECTKGHCGVERCDVSMRYAEGSMWSAYEAMDLCYAGGPHDEALSVEGPMTNVQDVALDRIDPVEASQFVFELSFGCQNTITGLFIKQMADGILGMEDSKTSFWKQMHAKGAIPREEFSLCFSRSDFPDRGGTGAGAMTLGGVDPRLHATPMVFAKNQKRGGTYAVRLKAVYLREGGGMSARTSEGDMLRMHQLDLSEDRLNSGSVIVDSGTTDTYFTNQLKGTFKRTWKELTGRDYDNHLSLTLSEEEVDGLPTIIMIFAGMEGEDVGDEPEDDPNNIANYVGDIPYLSPNPRDVVVAIPARHYLEFFPDTDNYIPRIYLDERSGSVIGANAMMGHDIYFDIARGRIGFAESDCDYISLLMSEGVSVTVPPPKQTASSKTEVVPQTEDVQGQPYGKEGGVANLVTELLDDMRNECGSPGCRGIAALLIVGTITIVIAGIRKALARRRMVRQYQEAEVEISDLALESNDGNEEGDEGGYTDEPTMPQII